MHQDLYLFPYETHSLQLQTDANKAERCASEQTTNQRMEDHPDFLDLDFISDEANFHLSGHVNKENIRFWAQAHEHQYHPLSVEI